MATITQDIRYLLSLIKYAERFGVTKAAIKYKTNRQYIYRWKRRYDGSIESLRDHSRRPHHHPVVLYYCYNISIALQYKLSREQGKNNCRGLE